MKLPCPAGVPRRKQHVRYLGNFVLHEIQSRCAMTFGRMWAFKEYTVHEANRRECEVGSDPENSIARDSKNTY